MAACDAAQLLTDGCAFQDLGGLQLRVAVAQLAANWLGAVDVGVDVTADAVLDRACESGIAFADQEQLRESIASSLCALT